MEEFDQNWTASGKIQVEERQTGRRTKSGEPYWMHMARRSGWLSPAEQLKKAKRRMRRLAIATILALLWLFFISARA